MWKSTKWLDKLEKEVEELNADMKKGAITAKQYGKRLWEIDKKAKKTWTWVSWLWDWMKWLWSWMWAISWWALAAGWVIAWVWLALGWAIRTAISFEDAFTGVKKTIDWTPEQFKEITDWIKALSAIIPVSVEELAKIAELWGQLGIAREDIVWFTETIAKIAVTTNLTAEEAAVSFAKIAWLTDTPIEKVWELWNSLVALWNNFKATESEIMAFATRIAWTASIAWLTADNVLAISTAFVSAWIQAEAWWSVVNKALLTISKAAQNWWKELELIAKTSWMTAKEFQKQWAEKPAEAFSSFTEWLWKQGIWASNTLAKLFWKSSEVSRAFLSVAKTGGSMKEAIKLANDEFMNWNALQEEADKAFDKTSWQLTLQKNQWKLFWNELVDWILPALTLVTWFFTKRLPLGFLHVKNWINMLWEHMKTWMIIIWVAVAKWVNNAVWKFTDFKDNIWAIWKNIVKFFTDWLWPNIKIFWENLPRYLKRGLDKAITAVENFINAVSQWVKDLASFFWFDLKIWEVVLPKFGEAETKAKEYIKNSEVWYSKLTTAWKDAAKAQNKILDQAVQWAIKARDAEIKKWFDSIAEFSKITDGVVKVTKDGLKKEITDKRKALVDSLWLDDEKTKWVWQWLNDRAKLQEEARKKQAKAEETARKEREKAEEEARKKEEKRKEDKIKTEINRIKEAQKNVNDTIKESEKTIKWYDSKIKKVWDTFQKLKENATKNLETIKNKLLNLWEKTAKNLWDRFKAIWDKIKWIKDKILDIPENKEKQLQDLAWKESITSKLDETKSDVDVWFGISAKELREYIALQKELNELEKERKLITWPTNEEIARANKQLWKIPEENRKNLEELVKLYWDTLDEKENPFERLWKWINVEKLKEFIELQKIAQWGWQEVADVEEAIKETELSPTEKILADKKLAEEELLVEQEKIENELALAEESKNNEIALLQTQKDEELAIRDNYQKLAIWLDEVLTQTQWRLLEKRIVLYDKEELRLKRLIALRRSAWLSTSWPPPPPLVSSGTTNTNNNTNTNTATVNINANVRDDNDINAIQEAVKTELELNQKGIS